MTCNDCIHQAVCYRRVGMTSDSYADKCGDFEPSRQTATWEKFGNGKSWACTNCRRGVTSREKYCPECGCRMVDPQESEE